MRIRIKNLEKENLLGIFEFIGENISEIIDLDLSNRTITYIDNNLDNIPEIEYKRISVFLEFIDEKLIETWQVPNLPLNISEKIWKGIICPALEIRGAIPKRKLIVGKTYLGDCRNSEKAIWKEDHFVYQRTKFGFTYPEDINHYEDDNGYDLFIPIKELD